MITKKVKVSIPQEAEARPVAVLVQIASQFDSNVFLNTKGKKINAKSIMGMMSIGLCVGEEIEIEAVGEDEEKAIQEVSKYLMTL